MLLVACALPTSAGTRAAAAARPNIVLIVLDDFGVDLLGGFPRAQDGTAPQLTPEMDALAAEGLLFTHVWTNPVCSPSRAQLLTGRHGFRTGIGKGINCDADTSLAVDVETLLPRALVGYDSTAVGKWHLASLADWSLEHPLDGGFGAYAGSLFNLAEEASIHEVCRREGALSYVNWLKVADRDGDGCLEGDCVNTYATTDTVDDAVMYARAMRGPWFLYVAFNAPHWPLNRPPRDLCPARPRPKEWRRDAMVEILDREIGRMVAEIRAFAPDTVVMVIGDNGTDPVRLPGDRKGEDDEDAPGAGDEFVFGERRGKASLYESGVHVPLIVSGPGVVPGTCDALVSSTDLYATICELAGVPSSAEDSVSLVPYLRGARAPLRRTLYAEVFAPNQPSARAGHAFAPRRFARALRDERWKLVVVNEPDVPRIETYHDLERDPGELHDLLAGGGPQDLADEARAHYEALRAELAAMGVD